MLALDLSFLLVALITCVCWVWKGRRSKWTWLSFSVWWLVASIYGFVMGWWLVGICMGVGPMGGFRTWWLKRNAN